MVWALPIWTLLIWTTRIRNILGADGHARVELLVPVALTVLAVAALVDRQRGRGLRALVVATVGIWAVRLPLVLVHHHDAPFKVVHAVLAVVSIGLAVAAWSASSRPTPVSPSC